MVSIVRQLKCPKDKDDAVFTKIIKGFNNKENLAHSLKIIQGGKNAAALSEKLQ
jgi:hypothetical protein